MKVFMQRKAVLVAQIQFSQWVNSILTSKTRRVGITVVGRLEPIHGHTGDTHFD